jgi:hypothetical protein
VKPKTIGMTKKRARRFISVPPAMRIFGEDLKPGPADNGFQAPKWGEKRKTGSGRTGAGPVGEE